MLSEVLPRVLWEIEALWGVLPRVLRQLGVLQGVLPGVLNVGRQQKEHSREHSPEDPQFA